MPLFNLAPNNYLVPPEEVIKTPIIKTEISSEGVIEKTLVFEEEERDNLDSLTFEDEKISALLKNGITPKHLNITEDERIGGDADLQEAINLMNDELNPKNE